LERTENSINLGDPLTTTTAARESIRPSGFEEPLCVPIPAGWFRMGCEQGRDEEKPVHRVCVDAFEMAVYQVRNRDWALFMEATCHPAPANWADPEFHDPDQPVVAVSWVEAVKYCDWLTYLTSQLYRLPTEAEWERAARGAREDELYPWGNAAPSEWPEYVRRWGGDVRSPLPVGQATPNAFGIYDIGENVHEWCADWFDKGYYAVSPERNPQGSVTGTRRASRGGSWRHQIKSSRSAARSSIPPHFEYADYGFRVVRDVL
jgi:formylglycine-generating enzyme required for sulfatase activity